MLRISTTANADLQEIWARLSEYGAATANKTVRELSKKFNLIAANPKIGRVRHDYILDMRSFPFKRFMIFYFETDFGVEIYRVVHSARDIDALFSAYVDSLDPAIEE